MLGVITPFCVGCVYRHWYKEHEFKCLHRGGKQLTRTWRSGKHIGVQHNNTQCTVAMCSEQKGKGKKKN